MTGSDQVRAEWLNEEVIARLKHVMEAQGMTKADLARALNISSAQVTVWFSGRRGMTLRTLARIAHALGVRVRFGFASQRVEAGREPQRRQRKPAGIVVLGAPHGTVSGYSNHNCRCEPCRAARRSYDRRRRQDLHKEDIRGTELEPKEGPMTDQPYHPGGRPA